jgi:hypothetical protein
MRDTSPSSQLQAYMWIWNRFTEQGYGTSARCDHIKHTTWQCWQWKWTKNMIIFIGKFRELFDSIRFAPHEYSTCLVNHLRPQREASKLLEKCLLVFEASHYIYSLLSVGTYVKVFHLGLLLLTSHFCKLSTSACTVTKGPTSWFDSPRSSTMSVLGLFLLKPTYRGAIG